MHTMQSRIQGYMYNITSETDYSERMLPPTPPREKEASPPIPARHVSRRAIIDDVPPRQPAPQQSQYRADRPLVSSRAGASGAVFERGSESQVVVCCTPPLCTPECANHRSAFSVHLQAICTTDLPGCGYLFARSSLRFMLHRSPRKLDTGT